MNRLKHSIKFIHRDNKDLVYSSDKGDIFELNKTGLLILEQIKKRKNKEQIIEHLMSKTGEKKETVEKDLNKFLTMLKAKGIIE